MVTAKPEQVTRAASTGGGLGRRQNCLFLGVLFVFVATAVALHYHSFAAPMYYDSAGHLQSTEHLYASGDLLSIVRLLPQRPLAMTSFYLNYLIWGMDQFFFRLVNAVILALTGLMASIAFILILRGQRVEAT